MKRIGSRIDICICTFRRPGLAATLKSVAAQRLPRGVSIRVIVSDNDDLPSAKALVEECAGWLDLPIQYLHSPARNISIARNACLDAVSGDYFAFIDDDETATGNWLSALVAKARQSGADVVLGPVRARYDEHAPDWLKAGNFHETRPVWVKGEIRTGYSCNVLVKVGAASVIGRRFDLARGKSGGEDTEFFDAVFAAGGRIEFAPEAWVEEPVPENRACFKWLARRRFRSGQTHGGLLRRKSASGVAKQLPIAFAKFVYSLGSVFAPPFHEVSAKRALLRAVLHAGAMTGLLGWRQPQIYGGPDLPSSETRYR
ncbi:MULTISPECIES: glycosyltransferase family 2 protein [Mesorhizobium]|uniref:Glycosyltransferase n=1 Tax=Mesorhizobium denitrificans TaxID=2294114 RepID=A0A371X941_9HYPH|nr:MULTISPECIES: glycosyltransferase family 2 protein [Mesorhizobium]RFC65757.1 glycosyltransferase [Mesorhizobium denitrificans]